MKCDRFQIMAYLLVGLCLFQIASGADDRKQTTASAVYLLRASMRPSRDGKQIRMLRALRQLKDPDLTPLFEELAQNPNPVLKIHGILGLAECDPQSKLDLLRIASIEDAGLQAQVISAAMDSDLLSDDEAKQLINWPGLDVGVRVLVATQLIDHGKFDKPEILDEAIKSKNLARRGFALMLKAHLGDRQALAEMDRLHTDKDPTRDRVRQMLLRSALRYNFQIMGPWAMSIASHANSRSRLGMLAIKTAMRFKIPQAQAIWKKWFSQTKDLAQQTRLALLVLRESQTLSPSLFQVLIAMDNPLLSNIGKAGRAIASHQDIADHVIALIGMDNPHPIANAWALQYARFDASREDSAAILLALVLSFENVNRKFKPRLLEDAIEASNVLITKYPDEAQGLLRPILENPQTDPVLLRGLLLAMIRSHSERVLQLLDGLKAFSDRTARHLVLLIKARYGVTMSRQELRELELIVRGGGVQDDTLRVQAGWAYLKMTRQVEDVLPRILGE